jgi:hypothetical protein
VTNYNVYWDIRGAIVSDVSNAVDSAVLIRFMDNINKALSGAATVLINSSVEAEVDAAFDEVIEDYEEDS